MILDSKLKFDDHINHMVTKINKTIGLIQKFQSFLPRNSLITINKSFIRPYLDNGDVIYCQGYDALLQQKL